MTTLDRLRDYVHRCEGLPDTTAVDSCMGPHGLVLGDLRALLELVEAAKALREAKAESDRTLCRPTHEYSRAKDAEYAAAMRSECALDKVTT